MEAADIPRSGLALVLAFLLLPLGHAAASPVHGSLEAARDLALRGQAEVTSSSGALDLSAAVLAGAPLNLRLLDGHAERTTYETRGVAGVWDDSPRRLPPERAALRDATLSNFTCAARDCVVLLFATEGRVGLRGEPQGALALEEDAWRRCGWFCGAAGDFAWAAPAGSLRLAAGEDVADAALVAEGRVGLLLRDATVEVAQDGRKRVLAATRESRPLAGGPVAAAYEGTASFVVAEGQAAGIVLPPGAPATLRAPASLVALEGAFSSPSAAGHVTFRGSTTRFDGEPVEVVGNVTLSLGPADPALPLAGARDPGGPFEGDASRVRVGSVVAAEPAPGNAAAVATLAGTLALLALLASRLALPLYSRIAPGDVLENGNRKRVFGALRDQPGATRADLARRLALSAPVVQHHLRMLEAHRFVASRRDGRARRFFVSGDAPDAGTFLSRAALRDPSRGRVARAVAEGARTQRDLVARTGFSQRLVSYHLARLARLGLVRAEGAQPQRYLPTEPLLAALAAAAPGEPAGGSASSAT